MSNQARKLPIGSASEIIEEETLTEWLELNGRIPGATAGIIAWCAAYFLPVPALLAFAMGPEAPYHSVVLTVCAVGFLLVLVARTMHIWVSPREVWRCNVRGFCLDIIVNPDGTAHYRMMARTRPVANADIVLRIHLQRDGRVPRSSTGLYSECTFRGIRGEITAYTVTSFTRGPEQGDLVELDDGRTRRWKRLRELPDLRQQILRARKMNVRTTFEQLQELEQTAATEPPSTPRGRGKHLHLLN